MKRVNRSEKTGSSSGRKFKGYKKPSAESVKERATKKSGTFDSIFKNGVDRFTPKVGENVVRVLPPTFEPNEEEHYFMEVFVHSRVGPDNSDYLCLRKMLGKSCALCNAAKAAEDAEEVEEAKNLKVNNKYVGWVLDRNDEDNPNKPQAYYTSWTQNRDLSALCISKRNGEVLYPEDPDDGYDIIIKRQGQGLNTKYLISIDRESTPVNSNPKKQATILDWITENPINEQLEFKSNDYLKQVIKGEVEDKDEDLDNDDEEDNEEEEAQQSKKKLASKGKSKAKAKDEDEPPFDEEDEEEEAPKKKAKRKPEPEEDEEDEDEPAPKSKTKRKPEPEEDEEEDTEDEPEEDDDEEEERPKSKTKRKPDPDDDDEETEDEPEEEDDEEEEERPAKKKTRR